MARENYNKVKQVLWFILLANIIVAMIKIIMGYIIKSTSLTADGFHSLSDASSNIIGLIGIHFASQPTDEDHPYGHEKFETLAGLFIAGILFMVSGKIIIEAIHKLFNPVEPEISLASLIALLITLFINLFVCFYEHNQGKKLNSQILISDSIHTRSDIYISLGVLITLSLVKFGLPPVIDPVVSVIVALFIIQAAYEIFIENSNVLLDKAVVDTERIKNITLSFEQVKDTHKIRSRGSNNSLFIDMHIMIEPELNVIQSHKLIHDIQEKIRKELNKNVQVIIHLEPFQGIEKNNRNALH